MIHTYRRRHLDGLGKGENARRSVVGHRVMLEANAVSINTYGRCNSIHGDKAPTRPGLNIQRATLSQEGGIGSWDKVPSRPRSLQLSSGLHSPGT